MLVSVFPNVNWQLKEKRTTGENLEGNKYSDINFLFYSKFSGSHIYPGIQSNHGSSKL